MANSAPSSPDSSASPTLAAVEASENQKAALRAVRDEAEAYLIHCIASPIGLDVNDEPYSTGNLRYTLRHKFAAYEAARGEYAPLQAVALAKGYADPRGSGRTDAIAVFSAQLFPPPLGVPHPAANGGQQDLRKRLDDWLDRRILAYLQGDGPLMEGAAGITRGLWHFRIDHDGACQFGEQKVYLNPAHTLVYPEGDTTPEAERYNQVRWILDVMSSIRSATTPLGLTVGAAVARSLTHESIGPTASARSHTLAFRTSW